MLVGRELECELLSSALASSRSGAGRALLLVGEPGIGKTTLLQWIRGHSEGIAILETRGIEAASDLPYAGLGDLLTPILDRLDSLPEPQAATLGSALGLGPPGPVDRLAIGVATIALLAAAAEDDPLLVLVDDLQWVDSASRDALSFATRRLSSLPVLVATAQRTAVGDGRPAIPGAEIVAVTPLSPDDAARVVAEQGEIAPEVVTRLLDVARGNPLALVELPQLLTEDQLAGTEPLGDPIPTANGLERAFAARLSPLSESGRLAVLLMAADSSTLPGVVRAALESLGIGEDPLEEVEKLGLVSLGESVEFRHPLVRSASYHGADGAQRRAAHRVLAEVDPDPDRRAWHLAAAKLAPDEQVAIELEAAAERALARGALGAAAAALERAAAFTHNREEKGARLARAAASREEIGDFSRAEELVREALRFVDDAAARARVVALEASVVMARGHAESASHALRNEADKVIEVDPALAAEMLAKAADLELFRFEATKMAALMEHARALGGPARKSTTPERVMLALAKVLTGDPAGRALLLDVAAEARADAADGHRLSSAIGLGLMWIEEYDAARAILQWAIRVQRAGGALKFLAWSLDPFAELELRTGRWVTARAAIHEAIDLFEETKQWSDVGFARATAAQIEAARGDEDACRAHAADAIDRELASGLLLGTAEAGTALGLLELGRGNHEAARAALEPVERIMRSGGVVEPWVLPWTPDLIEACIRDRAFERAREVLERFESQAAALGRVSALAAAARCRGLLAREDAFAEAFAEALSLHEQVPTPFERARTELCFGERLRRARRRKEARDRLRNALQTFERLGAKHWAERARAELRASGQSVRTPAEREDDALTPQELQVAALVAGGATNREAAAALFLSVKTIEFHLGHVYRKLGIRSRTELARVVG